MRAARAIVKRLRPLLAVSALDPVQTLAGLQATEVELIELGCAYDRELAEATQNGDRSVSKRRAGRNHEAALTRLRARHEASAFIAGAKRGIEIKATRLLGLRSPLTGRETHLCFDCRVERTLDHLLEGKIADRGDPGD